MVDQGSARIAFGMIGVAIMTAPFFFACNIHLAYDNPVWKGFSLILSGIALIGWLPWAIVTSPVSLFFIGYAYFNE